MTSLETVSIIANLSTSISLLIVFIQLRASNNDRKLESLYRSIDAYSQVLTPPAENEQLAQIYYKGLRNISDLKEHEIVQFSCFVGQIFWSWEMIFHQLSGKRLAPSVWKAQVAIMDDLLKSPGIRIWWENRKHWYSKEFVVFVNERFKANVGRPIHDWAHNIP
jgi:hypothetical protein